MGEFTRLRLHAATVHLPPGAQTLAEATALGQVRGRAPDLDPGLRLPVATGPAVDLAATASRSVLERTGIPVGEVDDLYYAWTYYQGAPFWSPAHALADRTGLDSSNPIGIQQMCNGAAAGLHLARRAAAGDHRFTALLATGDAFRAPDFDRWSGDYGVLYGDAGTAVLVTSDHAPVVVGGPVSTLISLHTGALAHLEAMHRPAGAHPGAGPASGLPVDVQATKRRYLQEHGKDSLQDAMRGMVRKLLSAVVSDLERAGSAANGTVYLPRLMDSTLDQLYVPAVAEFTDRPLARRGHVTGHLGAGDLIANLAEAQQDHGPTRVDLFISAGAGFTISIAAIETPAGEDQ